LLFSLGVSAQSSYSIKGSAIDTTEKKPLQNATIMVVNAKDSILRKFTRATADGSFTVNGLAKGRYLLLVSYPGYAGYSEDLTLDAQPEHDFGKISMALKSRLLQDVIIKGEVTKIKMKGDTTEFNAKAYVIQPNSKVEDLLKQLSGMEVDKDGKITFQGQTVEKVLLDGEEFFGDDPTLITKNIRGDMVDKVQVYDKKSDQAAFTGIDDGVKIKTVNIKLKEDKKNGYFGKVDAGIGTGGYYQGEALFNKFKAKEKYAGYLTTANDGRSGLNWEDNQKYTDGSSDAGGDVLSYNYQGLPVSKLGGAHYDNKWDNDKQSINANYKAGSLDVVGTINTLTQNNLPGSVNNSDATQTFDKSVFREKLDFTYQIKLDTTSNLKIAADGAYRHTKNFTSYLTIGSRNDSLINRNARTTSNDADQHIMNASVFYTKKLKKKGRTISVLASQLIDHTHGDFYTNSEADFYDATGAVSSTQLINQYKPSDNKHTAFNSNITYTEPLSKYWSAIFNYGINVDDAISDKPSFNKSAAGDYNVRVDSLSSDYDLKQVSNQLGAMFNLTKDKSTLNFGTRASNVTFKQTDEYAGGSPYKRQFINWIPQAMYVYRFSKQESVRLNYDGNTIQPSITQIQPLKVNTDPLYVTIGNANLKPSFHNNIQIAYNGYRVLTDQNIYFNVAFGNTYNPIINNTVTDKTGKTTSQAANLTNKTPYNIGGYGGFERKIKGPDISVGFSGNYFSTISYNYTNGVLNTTNSTNYSGRLSISKYENKKYDLYFIFGPSYTINESSLQKINSNGPGFSSSNYINVYLPGKFQISTDIFYTYKAKTASFDNDF